MTVASQVALALLFAATVLTVARAVRPSSGIGDRAVAFDMIASLIQSGLFMGAALLGDGVLVELALLLGLLGFLTSVTVARFIERTDP
jgi:multicomponent Na+:H+ antiporter subunit F